MTAETPFKKRVGRPMAARDTVRGAYIRLRRWQTGIIYSYPRGSFSHFPTAAAARIRLRRPPRPAAPKPTPDARR